MYFRSQLMKFFCNRIRDGTPDAPANDGDFLLARRIRGASERSDEVVQAIPLVHVVQRFGGCAHDLKNDGDAPFLRIVIRDGQGNAFSLFVRPQNDKLPRVRFFRDRGCFDLHERDRWIERLFLQNPIHTF